MGDDTLIMWTVYERPRDYPDNFVARRWEVHPGGRTIATRDMFVADTLKELRTLLPRGLTCLPRFDNDDPKIVEVWL